MTTNNNMTPNNNMLVIYNPNNKRNSDKFDYRYYIKYIIDIYNSNKEICDKISIDIVMIAILLNYIDLLYILSHIFFIGMTYISVFNIYNIITYINKNNISSSDLRLCFIDKIPQDILHNMVKELLLLCVHWTIYSSVIICISIFTYIRYIFNGLITSLVIQFIKLQLCIYYSKIYLSYFNLYKINKPNHYIDCPIIFNRYLSKLITNNIFNHYNMGLLIPLQILDKINSSYELGKPFPNINMAKLFSFFGYIYNTGLTIKNIFV